MGTKFEKLKHRYKRVVDAFILCDGKEPGYEILAEAGYSFAQRKIATAYFKKLMRRPDILEAIEERRSEVTEDERIRALVSIEMILREEMCIAFSNIANYLNPDGTLNVDLAELPEELQRAISGIDITELRDRKTGEVIKVTYRPRLWDKGKAIERIGKILGAYVGSQRNPAKQIVDDPAKQKEAEATGDVASVLKAIFGQIDGATRGLPPKLHPEGLPPAGQAPGFEKRKD